MKRFLFILLTISILSISGCAKHESQAQIVATTLPVYEFTAELCQDTGLTVSRLITENISCLHDYTLQTKQMRSAESAQLLIKSGAGLDDFLDGIGSYAVETVDCSAEIPLLCNMEENEHSDHNHEHHHEEDPHIWLSPLHAKVMVANICNSLVSQYPEQAEIIRSNRKDLDARLDELYIYGTSELQNLCTNKLITFHDGFSYLAQAFDLEILHAIEEESGSEASAEELIEIIEIIESNNIYAIFVESNGSASAAEIISKETNSCVYELDMCMGERGYFQAMYHNIDTLKEALG